MTAFVAWSWDWTARRTPAGRARSRPGSPPRGGRVVCMRVVEPVGVSSMPFVPRAMRSQIAGRADAVNRSRVAAARRQVEASAAALERAGWRARGIVQTALPLAGLLATVRAERADVLVLGARGGRRGDPLPAGKRRGIRAEARAGRGADRQVKGVRS